MIELVQCVGCVTVARYIFQEALSHIVLLVAKVDKYLHSLRVDLVAGEPVEAVGALLMEV